MSYLLYFVIVGIIYLITLSTLWSVSFIMLSKFIKNLYILGSISLIAPVTLMLYLGGLLQNRILTDSTINMLYPLAIFYVLVFLFILKITLFKKLPGPIVKQVLPSNTKYWNLSTGSCIAYWFYEAKGPKKGNPIVFVHGGAGAHVRNIDRAFFEQFTTQGHDVYLYDQAGGGFSDYLDVTDYSMNRFTEDLEAIRKQIHTEKMILTGQSFGARICAYYASVYNDNVTSIIFAGPGGLKPSSIREDIKNKKSLVNANVTFASDDADTFKPSFREIIRFAFSIIMCKVGGTVVVSQFVTQKEITEYATRMIPEAIGRAYHKKYAHLVPTITSGGINVIVNVIMSGNYDKISLDMINKLKGNNIPVIILRAAYDYVPWAHTKYYKEVFHNHYLVYIPESGHIAWSVNESDTFTSMTNFIKGNTSELVCYNNDQNPLYERLEAYEKETIF